MFEAYFEAKALHPKTNKFVGVRSLKAYRGLPRNAGLLFLVGTKAKQYNKCSVPSSLAFSYTTVPYFPCALEKEGQKDIAWTFILDLQMASIGHWPEDNPSNLKR